MATDLSPQMAVSVQWIIPMKSSQSSAWYVGCVQTVQVPFGGLHILVANTPFLNVPAICLV